MRRTLLTLGLTLGLLTAAPVVAGEETLTFEGAEVAGICGFRPLWDTPIPLAEDGVRTVTDAKIKDRGGAAPWSLEARDNGPRPAAISFDAIHRSLLVRFPGAAEAVYAQLRDGRAVAKVELVLPFVDEELWPWGEQNWAPPGGGYIYRANWGVDKLYRAVRPKWHAVGWALHRPWAADAERGPTYNAYINGAGYWARFGAQQAGQDRSDRRFGPVPVHYEHPEGRMDVTACLTDEAFGASLPARLRRLADCGFLIRKWETYDHVYFTGAYEWATATGGRAIVIDRPRLVVTFREGEAPEAPLPPAAEIPALAAELRDDPDRGGAPTAVMPDRAALKQLAADYATTRPEWMPAWQWQQVRQLLELQYGTGAAQKPFWYQFLPDHIKGWTTQRFQPAGDGWVVEGHDPQYLYHAWTDQMLGKQYRGWHGFEAARTLLPWFVYREAMPGPAVAWFEDYWTAWLMPERPTAATSKLRKDPHYVEGPLVHPMVDDPRVGKVPVPKPAAGRFHIYYQKTGDWRGNRSFYRSGFNYTISTTNFNNSASMGALLGGALIGSERALADGRHGQANFPLKLWTWYDGTTQEEIDDYYFGITVKAQKMIADFGPEPFDRLLGRSQLLKSMTMLSESYHPGLRRWVAGAARTATHLRLGTQEGLYGVLHTLSRRGTYTDLPAPRDLPEKLQKFGHEYPLAEVARQAVQSPFAPLWYQGVIDEKPLPFQTTAAYKMWGGHREHPMMRRTYLGENYGLYSVNAGNGNIPIFGHWRREEAVPQTSRALGTMFVRFGINRTRLVNSAPGWIKEYGTQATLHHRNKLIVATSPLNLSNYGEVKSVQSSVALYNYESPEPSWRLYAGETEITALPFTTAAATPIAIDEGAAYIGILPLPATDLGRDAEVVLRPGEPQTYYDKYTVGAALVIDNYNHRHGAPLPKETDWQALDRAYNGFVIEVADAADFADFAAFRAHLAAAKLTASFDAETAVHTVRYESGGEVLETASRTTWNGKQTLDHLFVRQEVDGEPAYLPADVERDSPFSVQARTGRLEKGGALLQTRRGRLAVLQREPHSGAVLASNPLAQPTPFRLETPEGVVVRADGEVGLCFVTVEPAAPRLTVDIGWHGEQAAAETAATALVVFGLPEDAAIELNGRPLPAPETLQLDGRTGAIVPLQGQAPNPAAVRERLAALAPDGA
jgi:hypothetical protein